MEKTIFVVDDNAMSLSVAETALEKYYRVISLSSAQKMFAILEKITPELILLDIEMPEMDGFEAMKRLKETAGCEQIPVIFLTGLTDPVNEKHALELGALDFFIKPISEPVLLNRIKNYLDMESRIAERTKLLTERLRQLETGKVP
jgi:putative two-component system response regulator